MRLRARRLERCRDAEDRQTDIDIDTDMDMDIDIDTLTNRQPEKQTEPGTQDRRRIQRGIKAI